MVAVLFFFFFASSRGKQDVRRMKFVYSVYQVVVMHDEVFNVTK